MDLQEAIKLEQACELVYQELLRQINVIGDIEKKPDYEIRNRDRMLDAKYLVSDIQRECLDMIIALRK